MSPRVNSRATALRAVWGCGWFPTGTVLAEETSPRWKPYHTTTAPISVNRTRVMGIGCYVTRIPTGWLGCFVKFVIPGQPGTHAPFRSLLHRSPVAPRFGLTGTFFDPGTWRPLGTIIVDGRQLCSGGIGHALCVRPDGTVAIKEARLHHAMRTHDLRNVLRSGPRLVQEGAPRTDYRAQGFRDPRVVTKKATRCGLGLRTRDAKTEMIALVAIQPITAKTFGRMLLNLGCHAALNMDGGTSVALFGKGRIIRNSGRALTNIVVAF